MLSRTRATFFLALSIGIAACGSSATTPSPSASSPPPSASTTPAPTAEPAATPAATQQAATVYRVRKGDTLWAIARRFKVKLDELIAANPQLKDPNKLAIGDRINIPNAASPSPSA